MIRFKIKELLYKHESFFKTGKPKELKEVSKELNISKFTITKLVNGCENIGTRYIETFMKYFNLENHQINELIEIYELKKRTKKKSYQKSRKLLGFL